MSASQLDARLSAQLTHPADRTKSILINTLKNRVLCVDNPSLSRFISRFLCTIRVQAWQALLFSIEPMACMSACMNFVTVLLQHSQTLFFVAHIVWYLPILFMYAHILWINLIFLDLFLLDCLSVRHYTLAKSALCALSILFQLLACHAQVVGPLVATHAESRVTLTAPHSVSCHVVTGLR